jgi:hypothetical protein
MRNVRSVKVDGFAIDVRDFVCIPSPVSGERIEVRFRSMTDFDPRLRGAVTLAFTAGGAAYRGRFRLTSATLGPLPASYRFTSVGAVEGAT